MTDTTVSAAGGALPRVVPPTLTFDVKRGMYGTCRRIGSRIGLAGEMFAEGYFDDIHQKWDVVIFDARMTEYSVDVSNREQGIDQVKSIMALEYSRTFMRRAA
jgi:hypothetical protein